MVLITYDDHIDGVDHLKEGTSLGRSHPANSGRAQRNNSSYQNILFWVQINEKEHQPNPFLILLVHYVLIC